MVAAAAAGGGGLGALIGAAELPPWEVVLKLVLLQTGLTLLGALAIGKLMARRGARRFPPVKAGAVLLTGEGLTSVGPCGGGGGGGGGVCCSLGRLNDGREGVGSSYLCGSVCAYTYMRTRPPLPAYVHSTNQPPNQPINQPTD
jgi:hypothetical protein